MSDTNDLPRRLHLPVLPNSAHDEGTAAPKPEDAEDSGAEFPPGASVLPEESLARRTFMKLATGTLALAGVGVACKRPREEIVPYVRQPPLVPGNPLHFATAFALDGEASGLLVRSFEGRPTKVEGNPQHPDSLGATGVFEQAILMGLYDEERAKELRSGYDAIARERLGEELTGIMRAAASNGGARLRFLVEPTSSPTLLELRARISERYPRARFVTFSSGGLGELQAGTQLAFGQALVPRYDLASADVVVALDADFLNEGPASVRLQRAFAERRVPPRPNRLWVAEPALSVSGMMADHRARVPADAIEGVARALAAELGKRAGFEALAPLGAPVGPAGPAVEARFLRALVEDLVAHQGRAVVFVGRRQPPAVQALGHALNLALGAVGAIVRYGPALADGGTGVAGLAELVDEINRGAVDTLVITAWNPVYTAPADIDVAAALRKVKTTLYHSLYEDETAPHVHYFVPAAHLLETWGDTRASDGTATILQPLIEPIWGGLRELDIYALLLGEADRSAYEYVRAHWEAEARRRGIVDVTTAFEGWLAEGVVPDTVIPPVRPPALRSKEIAEALAERSKRGTQPKAGLSLAFALDPRVYDGRFANNPWLEELPDPVTKLTWDNAALIAAATAQRLGLRDGDVIRIDCAGRSLEAPVLVQPGHADDALTLAVGYGRQGREQRAQVGVAAGRLRTQTAGYWFTGGAEVTRLSRRHRFAITQHHWRLEGRGHALAATVAALGDPHSHIRELVEHARAPKATLHEPIDYTKMPYRWGMAIDLSKCTGCSACVVACQAENNIPVVGKDQVAIGREMHWLRIDRYFEGPVDNPQVVVQPMLCQHCETAPCEYVCPVNATVHSDEGLNDMVYNRCIGTRYCSNNCPYKVRRFNYLGYNGDRPNVERLSKNPDVTVRSRGVMEKCTYCVQRIERGRIDARLGGRRLADGAIATACEQACPTGAIVFGSLNDPNARVTQLHGDSRRYDVLSELGTRPRTAYLVRVKNPHPALEGKGHG